MTGTIAVHAPYDGSLIGEVPSLTADDVDRAVATAKAALHQQPLPRWRRAEILDRAADRMAVTMLFAGGAAIRLEGAQIKCRVSDIGEPWPTQWRPNHPIDDAAA